jgi:hypothetical protein
MNRIQKELVTQLKESAKKLRHSPQRREVSFLAKKCYKYFGSFNKAKELAALTITNKRITNFPEDAFKIDKKLAGIASYLTFDGHLYKDLSGFYLSSKSIKSLKDFEKLIKRKFNIKGKYYLNSGGAGKHKTHKFAVFNKRLAEKLYRLGIPKGDKTIQRFNVPKWIYLSEDFSREYLKVAFLCEGSGKEEAKRTPRIQINTAKSDDILASGFEFMNSLRKMLLKFNINTTKCFIAGRRTRKDGVTSKDIRFRIDIKDNNKFINEIMPILKGVVAIR